MVLERGTLIKQKTAWPLTRKIIISFAILRHLSQVNLLTSQEYTSISELIDMGQKPNNGIINKPKPHTCQQNVLSPERSGISLCTLG